MICLTYWTDTWDSPIEKIACRLDLGRTYAALHQTLGRQITQTPTSDQFSSSTTSSAHSPSTLHHDTTMRKDWTRDQGPTYPLDEAKADEQGRVNWGVCFRSLSA